MLWKQRLVNQKELLNKGFDAKDEKGNYSAVWNEIFEGNTPKEARKAAKAKYPTCKLGTTKKVK